MYGITDSSWPGRSAANYRSDKDGTSFLSLSGVMDFQCFFVGIVCGKDHKVFCRDNFYLSPVFYRKWASKKRISGTIEG